MTASIAADPCPRCSAVIVTGDYEDPWCTSCEWNLGRPPSDYTMIGWRWADRILYRIAFRLTCRQSGALAHGSSESSRAGIARGATLAIAVVLFVGIVALAVLGGWLVVAFFFGPLTVVGLVLLLIAFALRPRMTRLTDLTVDHRQVDRGSHPTLFKVIDRVSAAVGSPAPEVVLVGDDFNAFTTTVGLRRRRVLCLGLPLWAVASAQERIALLGHEMGHFVNGDVRQLPLVSLADTTLGRISDMLRPDRVADGLFELAGFAIAATSSRLFLVGQLLLAGVSARDSQRAEYRTDELAARVGGTAGAIGLQQILLLRTPIDTVVRREARAGNGAAAWRAAADVARANQAATLPLFAQLSNRREVSVWASHPPSGLRLRRYEQRTRRAAEVVLTEPEAARMDEELAAQYERTRRELRH